MSVLIRQIEDYLHYCEFQKTLSEKTVKAYRIDLAQYAHYSVDEDVPLSKACITGYIQKLHADYKPKSAKRKLASLRAFISYLEFEEQLEVNPINKLRLSFKEPIALPKALPLNKIQRLLHVAHSAQDSAKSEYQYRGAVRDVAVIELLFATGVRVSELCAISETDIDLREGCVRIQGKGSRERIVFITNTEVLSVLRKYKKLFSTQINAKGWFFINRLGRKLSEQSVRAMILGYAQRANITEHITPHMIRHSFATLMLEEDVDIRYIQSILGHSSITTTQIYTHVSLNKQKRLMVKKHPRNKVLI